MRIVEIESQAKWDGFITSHPEANFLQSWDFYEFHKARGKKVVRRAAVNDKDEIVAAYAVVGSICAGMLGSTYASSHLNILLSGFSLNTDYQRW